MKLYVLDADYIDEGDASVIRLFCKDEKGQTVVCLDHGFEPYFYILPKAGKESELKKRIENIQSLRIKRVEKAKRIVSGESKALLKVFCFLSTDVPKARDIVKEWKNLVEEEFEYSINFYKRYLIDNQIEGWAEVEGEKVKKRYRADRVLSIKKIRPVKSTKMPKLRMMAFDIESVEEEGRQKIVMVSLKSEDFERVLTYKSDRQCGKYVEVVKDEKEMLQRFVSLVNEQDPDILLGYNSDEFDSQIIQKRAEELDVSLKLSRDYSKLKFARRARISTAKFVGIAHIDLYQFINNILVTQLQTEVLTLNAVAAELLGDQKIELEYEDIIEAWKTGKDIGKMARYCLKDSDLALRLGEFIVPQVYELSELCGQPLFDTSRMTYSQLVEWYLSKKAYVMENIIPNQPKWDEIEERRGHTPYVGGFVKEPIAGLHDDVAVMDFRSLYPSIIATFNISPETFNCSDCRQDGYKVPDRNYWFCKKRSGFVSTVIRELIDRRAKIKAEMKSSPKDSGRLNNEQLAVKTVTNATYGYLGFASSKWYCLQCAESAAAYGRFYIQKVISEAQKEGFTVIYGDTDSLFVKTNGELKSNISNFLSSMNKSLPGIVKLDLQGIYKRGIFIPRGIGPGTAKKRYALIDEKGLLTIRGLEKVRSDWSNIAKSTQEEVLRLILGKKDVKGAVKYVKGVIDNLKKGKISLKDLVIIEQLSKPLSEYKAIGPHVVAARKIKERGGTLGEAMPILFVITKGKGSISERAEPFEDADLKDIDTNYYITHQIIPASLRVLAVMGVTEEELLGESLKGFIK
jgi:DNA polymerase elongation subunit (family B)